MNTNGFFRRLQRSKRAVHDALGKLEDIGYNAYILDPDPVFDIVAINSMTRTICPEYSLMEEKKLLLIQVKGYHITDDNFNFFDEDNYSLMEANAEFIFDAQDFDKIIENEDGYLFCYFLDAEIPSNIIGFVWFNSIQLKKIKTDYVANYIFKADEKIYGPNRVSLKAKIIFNINIDESAQKEYGRTKAIFLLSDNEAYFHNLLEDQMDISKMNNSSTNYYTRTNRYTSS